MQQFYMDRLNALDARNCKPATDPVLVLPDGTEKKLPTCWEVCPVCEGRGTHVNPSIDAGGLTAEDFADDPEFAEDYFNGAYDQICNRCEGRTTVPVVDESRMSAADLALYHEQQDEERTLDAESRAEFLMGA